MATVILPLTGNRLQTASRLGARLLDSEIGSSWLVTRLDGCFILQIVDTLPIIRSTYSSTPGQRAKLGRRSVRSAGPGE